MWRHVSHIGDMKPAPSELRILKHLWTHKEQSLREIHDAVADDLGWSRSSMRKTVDRMVEKNMVTVGDKHGLNLYRAKAKKIPTLAAIIQQFTSDVLGLEGPLPVANLVRSAVLSSEELEELEAYLKKEANAEDKTKS